MSATALVGLTLGDFRDRVRRPVYLVTLLAAVGLGHLAVPPADGHWVIMALGEYRGEYNSAYVGVATALAGALWLTLGGFYVVRKGIARDEETRVGQILAASPMRSSVFLASKFLSSLLVLGSMLGVLVLMALVVQLVRGEDRGIDPVALLKPFLVLALPLIALTAAVAVLFETIPLLRGGAGNVVWFFVALVVSIGGQSAAAPFGGLGVGQVSESMGSALTRQFGDAGDRAFSLGLTEIDTSLTPFHWDGFRFEGEFLATRLLIVLVAVVLALLPTLWFGRFDPARAGEAGRADTAPVPPGPADPPAAPVRVSLPGTASEHSGAFGRLLAGEVRILVSEVSRWWWLGAAALTLAALLMPKASVTVAVLPALWVWPVLVWSRLGSRQTENGLEGLLGSYPSAHRRLLAEYGSGVVLTALMGAAPLVRIVAAGDFGGLTAWFAGVLFVPSLAQFLGVLCRTPRVFQALYLPLWYLVLNGVAALDFMGAVRERGEPAGPVPLFLAASLLLLTASVLIATVRRNVKS